MITSILGQRLQLFSQMVPSHRNKSPYHAFSCLRPVPLVASVGQPKLQHSTLLTRAPLELAGGSSPLPYVSPMGKAYSVTKVEKNKIDYD